MTIESGNPIHESYKIDLLNTLKCLQKQPPRIHIPARKELYSKNLNAPFHAYPEVFIQTGGATDFTCPESTFRLNTGELCVMPRGLPHAEIPINQESPYNVCVIGTLMGNWLFIRGRSSSSHEIHSYDAVILKNSIGHEVARYLDDISDHELLSPENRSPYILALLEAYFLRAQAALESKIESESSKRPRLIIQAENYARIHLGNSKLSIKRIATALNCTADHLSRQFHRSHGFTMIKWITRERIKMAKYLLETGQQNIAEIGWSCGFNTSAYFIHIFKQHTGMTPKTYRTEGINTANEEHKV
jgi:AraC-like DNA-binding protein